MIVKHFIDLGYSAVAEPADYHVDFKVYAIEGLYEDDSPCWHKAGSPHGPDPVDSIEEAEVCLHGHVNWDGCSNWYFDKQDRAMLHECDREGLLKIGQIMAACWDWTSILCQHWSEDVTGYSPPDSTEQLEREL